MIIQMPVSILVNLQIETEFLCLLIDKLTVVNYSGSLGQLIDENIDFQNTVSLYGQLHRN